MGTQQNYIPEDYQDLYEVYFLNPGEGHEHSLVHGLVAKYAGKGATDADIEDLTSAVFERMLRLKSLEKFNATRGNFGLYLQQIVYSVVCNWHRKNRRTPTRESVPLDLMPDESKNENVRCWTGGPLKALCGMTAESLSPEEATIAADLERRLFEIASTEKKHGTKSRGSGIEAMIKILAYDGEAKEVAETLGVAASTVTEWRRFLKARLNA
jgi:DNA-directed RNA polymerase specialized sigma24 family protein